MSGVPPLPRQSGLVRRSSDNHVVPSTWEGLYDAASELKQIKESINAISATGFVGAHLRPNMSAIEIILENEALKQFGLMGHLALEYKTPAKMHEKFTSPIKILAHAIHFGVLASGFVCTGSQTSDFNQATSWPCVVPPNFMNENGTTYSARYRPKSAAADKVIIKGVLQGENYIVTSSDPYSPGSAANAVHFRVKDFVKAKTLDGPPELIEAKERELLAVIEERLLGAALASSARASSGRPSDLGRMSPVLPPMAMAYPAPAGGFQGDLMPGVGGSMLFGPGNPQFDRLMGQQVDPRLGGRVPPGARYDPIGPFHTGEPDPDHEPMPGRGSRFI